MASAVGLRGDFDGTGVVRLARLRGHANQVRRLLAVAVIYDGGARHEAARVGGVGLQTVRDWVLRFNAQGPDGLLDGKAPGPRPVLGPQGSAHEIGLYPRCLSPGRGQECRPGAPALQHRRDDAPPRRNIRRCRAGRSCRAAPRSGGVAWLKGAGRARHYHPHAAAAQMPRGEPRRKRLAVHA